MLGFISEALGQKSLQTTEAYLDSIKLRTSVVFLYSISTSVNNYYIVLHKWGLARRVYLFVLRGSRSLWEHNSQQDVLEHCSFDLFLYIYNFKGNM